MHGTGLRSAAAAFLALAAVLEPHGLLYSGKSDWETRTDRAWSAGGSRRLDASDGKRRLRVASEPAEDEAAGRRLLEDWSARLAAQFDGELAYPGMVTKRYEVPAALQPRPVPAEGRFVWILPATRRRTFGAGAEDLVRYRAVLSYRWCAKARRAVEVAVFLPKEDFSQEKALSEEAAFSCAR